MKPQKHIIIWGLLFVALSVQAQNDNIDRILRQIEQFNQDLKAFTRLKQARYYDVVKQKSLSGLHVETNWLFLQHSRNKQQENPIQNPNKFYTLKIGQEFRLPGYYKSIDQQAGEMRNLLEAEQAEMRANILLKAKQYCYQTVYINKQLHINKIFKAEADKLVAAFDSLFAIGGASILEQQKAHILALDFENEANQLYIQKSEALHELALLNGNQHIYLDDQIYEPNAFLLPIDLIQKQAIDKDVQLVKYQQQVLLGEKETHFVKQQNRPILDLGYSLQHEAQSNLHGIYAGFTLPLWSNKKNLKAAQLQQHYQQFLMSNQKQLVNREVLDLYNKIANIERYLKRYEASLNKLENYEKTLKIALELGEMPLQEYIRDILDYKDMHYKYLAMEFEYHHLKNSLMRWYL